MSSENNSSEKLRDIFDIQISLAPDKARKLALLGKLEKNTTVVGNLDLSGTNITKLPDKLTVNGILNLSKTKLKKLPKDLTAKYLDITATAISEVPPCAKVEKLISTFEIKHNQPVNGARYLFVKQDNVAVCNSDVFTNAVEKGTLPKMPIKVATGEDDYDPPSIIIKGHKLPNDLHVLGFIFTDCKVLPKRLKVEGSLVAVGVTSLPNDLIADHVHVSEKVLPKLKKPKGVRNLTHWGPPRS